MVYKIYLLVFNQPDAIESTISLSEILRHQNHCIVFLLIVTEKTPEPIIDPENENTSICFHLTVSLSLHGWCR